MPGRVAIFGPHPLLSVAIEPRGGQDDLHFHAGGQGVWVARMAAEMGAQPILCGLIGGEAGVLIEALLADLPGERRLVATAGRAGSFVTDRRSGHYVEVASALAGEPSRHELDALVSATIAAALGADVLVVCNPLPGDALPVEVYGDLVADVRGNGTPVLVDLSSPRLDSALAGRPDLVKLNDWELGEYVRGPVSEPAQLDAAARQILDAGAGAVIVTRGERSALAFRPGEAWEITPPSFQRGHCEGCGDTMMGALAAAWAAGAAWEEVLATGCAAGAAGFLRHGLGSATADVVASLQDSVSVRQLGNAGPEGQVPFRVRPGGEPEPCRDPRP
jgi:1-phosphofructokinase